MVCGWGGVGILWKDGEYIDVGGFCWGMIEMVEVGIYGDWWWAWDIWRLVVRLGYGVWYWWQDCVMELSIGGGVGYGDQWQ